MTDLNKFCLISSGVYSSNPIAVANHGPFLILNLTVFKSSAILDSIDSESLTKTGYLPTVFTILPTSLVNLSLRDSETNNTSYFLAHFLTYLASLANLLISSKFVASKFIALA